MDAVRIERGRIRVAGVLVYLERAVAPPGPLPPGSVPRPYGVAPAALVAGEVVSSVADGEVVWLGFQPVDRQDPQPVRVRLEAGQPRDAVTGLAWDPRPADDPRNHLTVPPHTRLVGVPQKDGVHPYAAPARFTLIVGDAPSVAVVHLVGPSDFEAMTGRRPEPLDPHAAYTQWRAP